MSPAASPDPCPDPRGRPRPLPQPTRPPPSPAGAPAVSPVRCPVSCGRPCLLPGPCPVRRALPKVQRAPLQTRGRGHRLLGQALFLSSSRRGRVSRVLVWGKRKQTVWAAVKMSAAKEEAATWRLLGPGLIERSGVISDTQLQQALSKG
ncbi:keratinocyte proline-rich protein-like [Pan paniscus]|uniref:keratinocyte proline-rich protein-like n=1 Tax=Pan paniscus TaxID=9597 RepID=UPI0024368A34|nr:keratinocyte proline-rich protein-like [Pan paniscus]